MTWMNAVKKVTRLIQLEKQKRCMVKHTEKTTALKTHKKKKKGGIKNEKGITQIKELI